VKSSIARVGQIAGPAFSPGAWAKREWLPSLVISSRHLKALPETLSNSSGEKEQAIDWIPVDLLARIIVDLATRSPEPASSDTTLTFHLVNPHTTTWTALLPAIVESLKQSAPDIKVIPLNQWLRILRASAKEQSTSNLATMLEANPAVKLLEFYEGLGRGNTPPRLATEETEKVSSGLRELNAINGGWMKAWVGDWLA
jgi:hypothetical protein